MNIEPKYVNLIQATWLKEKGFDIPCFYFYEKGHLTEPYLENGSSTDVDFRVNLSDLLEHFNKWSLKVSAPEQWQVVEWLRLKHGIWVNIGYEPINNGDDELISVNWLFLVTKIGVLTDWYDDQFDLLHRYNSPYKACSAAIDYIIENKLI
jgi:hypothetical protein